MDAHVHLFPDRVFEAIWGWFDAHAWPIRYRLHSEAVLDHLQARGVRRVVGLHYAHRPGMAVSLNDYVIGLAARSPMVVPSATVYPGEPEARAILRRAFGQGARAVKIHCHVQKIAPDDPRMDPIYEEAGRAGVPVVLHAGREPAFEAYGVDGRVLCAASKVEAVLHRHPGLLLIVPHLGADEFDAYEALLDRHPGLYLDTTMVLGGYFPLQPPAGILVRRAGRLLYGTDFPNLPYAWDRELRSLASAHLPAPALEALLSATARKLFGLHQEPAAPSPLT